MRCRARVPAALAVALVSVATGANAAASGTTAPAGEIVFASTRATANPGEIDALAKGAPQRAVSSSPYAEVGLVTAPKGRAYAFWSDRSGPFRLMIARRFGGALRSVTLPGPTPHPPSYPPLAFSPDGTRLLIAWYVPAGSTSTRLRFAVADVRGGPARRIGLPCSGTPQWSPDGLLVACPDLGAHRVFVADLAGHVRYRARGTSVLWSPDGRLAIADATRTTIVDTRGHVLARLTGRAQAWSPDGRRLALGRAGDLVLAYPDGGARDRVVHRYGQYSPYGVAFTPDGRDLSYLNAAGARVLVPVAGGRARVSEAGLGSVWSNDGRLAFPVVKGTTATIEIGDRFGAHARIVGRIAFDDHGSFTLAWLGDGSRLLADTSVRDHADLWTMEAGGGAQTRLTSTGTRMSGPAWSADGARLAYSSAPFSGGSCGYCGGTVMVADADGRNAFAVPGSATGSASSDTSPSWRPGGTQLLVSDAYNAGVYVVGVDGSGRRQVAPPPAASGAWSPDGTTVAYVDTFDGGAIRAVNPAGGAPRRLLPGTTLEATSVTWSPDGRVLAFSDRDGRVRRALRRLEPRAAGRGRHLAGPRDLLARRPLARVRGATPRRSTRYRCDLRRRPRRHRRCAQLTTRPVRQLRPGLAAGLSVASVVRAHAAVQRVALHGPLARRADEAAEVVDRGAVRRAGGGDDVLLDHDRAQVVGAEVRARPGRSSGPA